MTEDIFLAQILGHKLLPGAAACVRAHGPMIRLALA